MNHWLITAILVAAAAFGGYTIGRDNGARTTSQSMSDAAAKSRAEIRARLERDLKACAKGESETQADDKNPSMDCQLRAYQRVSAGF